MAATSPATSAPPFLTPTDRFVDRHIGPSTSDLSEMLGVVGCDSLEALGDATIPEAIRHRQPLRFPSSRCIAHWR